MNLKKIVVPVLLVVVFGAYIVYERLLQGQLSSTPAINDNKNSTKYNDGEYTGDFADAFYGPVQIKAIIVGGRISDIQFLQMPDHQGHTLELTNETRPVLKAEAIKVQSANVDIVSGATQTSQAFIKSLASALTKAGSTNQPNVQVTPIQ